MVTGQLISNKILFRNILSSENYFQTFYLIDTTSDVWSITARLFISDVTWFQLEIRHFILYIAVYCDFLSLLIVPDDIDFKVRDQLSEDKMSTDEISRSEMYFF